MNITATIFLLGVLCVFLGGCASTHTHDVGSHWKHEPEGIDSLIIHMDDKIHALECSVFQMHPEENCTGKPFPLWQEIGAINQRVYQDETNPPGPDIRQRVDRLDRFHR